MNEELHVEGEAGRPIELPLTTGPATGYSWTLELPAGMRRLDDGPGAPPPVGQALGGASHAPLRVQADAGTYDVVARLVRPWEPDRPARTVTLHIDVH
jgi:predicted secreted protein